MHTKWNKLRPNVEYLTCRLCDPPQMHSLPTEIVIVRLVGWQLAVHNNHSGTIGSLPLLKLCQEERKCMQPALAETFHTQTPDTSGKSILFVATVPWHP